MHWQLSGLTSLLLVGSAAFDVRPTSLLSVATAVESAVLPIDEESFTAEDVFCSGRLSVANLAAPVIEELYSLAFNDTSSRSKKENRDRLARLFKSEEGIASFHAEKCAVVSNSGVMLNHKYGGEIDSSDLVFRFNDAEVSEEFAEAVGLHDDIRIMNADVTFHLLNSAHLVRLSHPQDTVYVAARMTSRSDAAYQRWKAAPKLRQDLHVALNVPDVQSVSQELLHRAYGDPPDGQRYRAAKERHITTGFFGMVLAMSMCDEVRAYGFLDSLGSQDAAYHYYGWFAKAGTNGTDKHHHPTYDQERHFWRVVATNHDGDKSDISIVPGFQSLKCHGLPP